MTLVLLLVGCAVPAPQTDAPWLMRDAQRAKYVVDLLAAPEMQGRGADTAGLDMAGDYIHAWFDRTALAAPFNDSYSQSFTIPGRSHDITQSLAVRSPHGGHIEAAHGTDFALQGMSGDGEFNGEAVFVGYGVRNPTKRYDSYRDLHDASLQGKIAIAFRNEPMDASGQSLWTRDDHWSPASSLTAKARWAAQHGAVALLVVTPPSIAEPDPLRPTRASLTDDRAAIPIFLISRRLLSVMLDSPKQRPTGTSLRKLQVACDNADSPPRPLSVTVQGQTKIDSKSLRVRNIAGVLPGVGPLRNETIVIGAHYDHLGVAYDPGDPSGQVIFTGADDNASGVAALLLLAEHFAGRATMPAPGRYLTLDKYLANRRTLMFIAFAAEERGLHGSRHYLASATDYGLDVANIHAMINLDMVGRVRDRRIWAFGDNSSPPWKSLLPEAAIAADLKPILHDPIPGDSDHSVFQEAGIPSIHLFSGMHADYHRPTDTADRVNTLGIARTTEMVERMILELWHDDPPRQRPRVAATSLGKLYWGRIEDQANAARGVYNISQ